MTIAGMTNSGSNSRGRGGGRGGGGGPGFAIYQDPPDPWLAALNRIMAFILTKSRNI